MKKQDKTPRKKPNVKVIVYSIVALIFLYLAYTVNWMFIIGSAILMFLNQRELIGKK